MLSPAASPPRPATPAPRATAPVPPASVPRTPVAVVPNVETGSFVAESSESSAHAVAAEAEGTTLEERADVVDAPVRSSGNKVPRIGCIEEFIERWPNVLTRVRRKMGVTKVAYMHDAMPVALDDKVAVLEFKKEFHFAMANENLRPL